MRAERDDDEPRVTRKTPERRLAYEIAIGIIWGGLGLAAIQTVLALIAWQIYIHDVKVAFGIPGH
ncbi:hypothetical protein C3F00_015550 [Pseudomonas sp. MWU13-2860]|nr:hypothetical protein C3F00_015550 [Pseudomonas sp. MWU13-2860]